MVNDSEQFFRLLSESIPNLVWTVDATGHVDYISSRFAAYLGLDIVSLEDENSWLEAVHPDERERCSADWHKAFSSGNPYEIEYRLRRADGKYLWHLGRADPIRDAEGK